MSTERVNILEELKVDVMSGAKVFEDRYFVVEEFLGDREARYSLFDEEAIVDTEFLNGEYIHTVYKRETNEEVFSSCFFNVNDLLDRIEEELDEIREEERKYKEKRKKMEENKIVINGVELDSKQSLMVKEAIYGHLSFGAQYESYLEEEEGLSVDEQNNIIESIYSVFRV